MPRKVWLCEFCRETKDTEAECLKHEKQCCMNPATKCCGTCRFRSRYGTCAIAGLEDRDVVNPQSYHCREWERGSVTYLYNSATKEEVRRAERNGA